MARALAAVRSALFVLFLAVTVAPWAIVGLVYSIFVRGERALLGLRRLAAPGDLGRARDLRRALPACRAARTCPTRR